MCNVFYVKQDNFRQGTKNSGCLLCQGIHHSLCKDVIFYGNEFYGRIKRDL